MFRAIGYLLLIWGVSIMLADAFSSFERAMVATFDTVETAALVSKTQIEKQSH